MNTGRALSLAVPASPSRPAASSGDATSPASNPPGRGGFSSASLAASAAAVVRHSLNTSPRRGVASHAGLKVLVACEYSGTVRDAFAALGHDAMSCDLLPTERDGWHYQGDVRDVLGWGWDAMIAHPPCTHLAVSGARWFKDKQAEQAEALEFVRLLLDAPIKHIALENPVSIISSRIRKADQTIQPWQYGHGEVKATCLWLKNLPKLRPTNIVEGREARVHRMPPGPDRWKERSRTFPGIAAAMASQWSEFIASTGGRQCA